MYCACKTKVQGARAGKVNVVYVRERRGGGKRRGRKTPIKANNDADTNTKRKETGNKAKCKVGALSICEMLGV